MKKFLCMFVILSLGLSIGGGQAQAADSLVAVIQKLHHPSNTIRIQAVNRLRNYPPSRALPILIKVALHDPSRYVSRYTLGYLKHFRDDNMVMEFIKALQSSHERVRARAAMALGIFKEGQAVPSLLHLLPHDRYAVCLSVIRALGKIGDKRATHQLVALLRNKATSLKLRLAAVRALGDIGDVNAIDALLELLDHPKFKGHVKQALRKIQRGLRYGHPLWKDLEHVLA